MDLNTYIKTSLYKNYGIKSHSMQGRHILYIDRFTNTVRNPFVLSCNGIIYNDKWEAICVPPYSFNTSSKLIDVQKYMEKNLYYIYAANDGTTVNLYYYDENKVSKENKVSDENNSDVIPGRWVISTTKGIEMDDVSFNNTSYIKMINDCYDYVIKKQFDTFDENEIEMDEEEFEKYQKEKLNKKPDFWSNLNKNYCYTIGFRHPDQHMFTCAGLNEYDIWFVQSVNLNIYRSENAKSCNFGISEIDLHLNLRQQKDLSDKFTRLSDIINVAKNSYNNYLTEMRAPNFGFILRSQDHNMTGCDSCIFIESTLMSKLRNIIYNIPKDIKTLFSQNTIQNKHMYLMLYKYLEANIYDKTMFELFPQYIYIFDKFDMIINLICNQIKKFDSSENVVKSNYYEIVKTIRNDILNGAFRININDKTDLTLIKNMIHNVKYTTLLFNILN